MKCSFEEINEFLGHPQNWIVTSKFHRIKIPNKYTVTWYNNTRTILFQGKEDGQISSSFSSFLQGKENTKFEDNVPAVSTNSRKRTREIGLSNKEIKVTRNNENHRKRYSIYFDGSHAYLNHSKDKGCAGWSVVDDSTSREICCGSKLIIGKVTNNIAEYTACLNGLLQFLNIMIPNIPYSLYVYGDSSLVIKQLNGEWKVKCSHLMKIHEEILKTLARLKERDVQVIFNYIPREKNTRADELSKRY